jgi:hypothetical protein
VAIRREAGRRSVQPEARRALAGESRSGHEPVLPAAVAFSSQPQLLKRWFPPVLRLPRAAANRGGMRQKARATRHGPKPARARPAGLDGQQSPGCVLAHQGRLEMRARKVGPVRGPLLPALSRSAARSPTRCGGHDCPLDPSWPARGRRLRRLAQKAAEGPCSICRRHARGRLARSRSPLDLSSAHPPLLHAKEHCIVRSFGGVTS